jgi:hypothetical protein
VPLSGKKTKILDTRVIQVNFTLQDVARIHKIRHALCVMKTSYYFNSNTTQYYTRRGNICCKNLPVLKQTQYVHIFFLSFTANEFA